MRLPDEVRVLPAHGAGSSCGKNLSTERQSTIGNQRAFNYACQPMSEEQFVAVVTEGQPAAPGYFIYNATLNKQERDLRDTDATIPPLTDSQVEEALASGAVLHDARDVQEFAAGHLRGSVNVPADGRMAETVGMVFTPDQPVVIIAPDGTEQEVATRFARIGFDNVVGYLPDPEAYFLSHQADVDPGQPAQRVRRRRRDGEHRRAGGRHPQRRRGRRRDGPGCAAHPPRRAGRAGRRARHRPAGAGLLRRWLAQQRRGEPAARPGLLRRVGHPGRIRRVGPGPPPSILSRGTPRNGAGPGRTRPGTDRPLRLGLRANLGQFVLLVAVNGLVGGMLGQERTVVPLMASSIFGLPTYAAALTFILAFGVAKAATNYLAGTWSDRFGRRPVLVGGWLVAVPVPLMLIWAPSWGWVVAANVLLGISQGLTWSTTVVMKIDLVGPARRGLAMGFNESSGYLAVAVTALATGYLAQALRPAPRAVPPGPRVRGPRARGLGPVRPRDARPRAARGRATRPARRRPARPPARRPH